jgi:hypothetical protein
LLAQTKKANDKICFIKNHNLCDKKTILIIFILWSTFILVLCLKNIFIWSLLDSLHAFTFSPSCFFYLQLLYIIYIISRNHTNLWNSWYVK